MDTDTDEYCLRWNNHRNILVSVFDSLLEKEMLVDVTLAAEGRFMRVHGLVLCACSTFFEELLSSHSDKQAIIILKDVLFSDLKALVEYMYKGEVNVTQDQLMGFLSSAEMLRIKGLASKFENSKQAIKPKKTVTKPALERSVEPVNSPIIQDRVHQKKNTFLSSSSTPTALLQPKCSTVHSATKMETDAFDEQDELCNDANIVKEEEEWNISEQYASSDVNHACKTQDLKDHKTPATTVKYNPWSPGGGSSMLNSLNSTSNPRSGEDLLVCPSCGRSYKSRGSLNRHRKFECGHEPQFKCPICQMMFKRKDKLRDHELRLHLKDPFCSD